MEHQLQLKKPLAFFDLETTGIMVNKDRIVEISIAKANIDGSVEIKTRRVNPGIPIPLEASLVHGIYDADVANEPNFKQVAKSLAGFLEGCDLAGFNSNRFDVPMLVEEFLRAEVDFDMKNRKLVDAQRIFHMMEPRNLTAAYRFYCDKELIGAHGAEADVLATLEVLNAQVKRYANTPLKDSEGNEYFPIQNDVNALHELSASNSIDFANRMIYNKNQVAVFNFGKHMGRPVLEVLKSDPSYYDWMMKGDFPMDTKRKLTEIKLQGFQR
ncbi:MAG: exonuclease domain-containing protein [Aquirufa sp.]|jgi:DNA polymerase-3 subunit epsilon